MRTHKVFLATIAAAGLVACSADRTTVPALQPTPALLRDLVIPSLPSPYYHFEYDSSSRVSKASFASGFTMYNVSWDRDHIVEIRDSTIADRDRLVYAYNNSGRVASIRYTDEAEHVYTTVLFTYQGRMLTRVERTRQFGGEFLVDKILTLSYDAGGNLFELTTHYLPVEGFQPDAVMTDRFEQYDDNVNVDAFSLLHGEFFDHLILLPGVQLQRGNPARVTHSGDGENYRVDYTYTYDDQRRPLTKRGEVTFSTGPNVGRVFETLSLFSYY